MKAIKKNKKVLIVVAVLSVIALSLSLVSSSGLASNSIWSSFWPLPPTGSEFIPSTFTPDHSTASAGSPIPSYPVKFSKTIDLSPNLPDSDKYIVDVLLEDGTAVRYLIGPIRSLGKGGYILPIPSELLAQIKLQPGEIVIGMGAIGLQKTYPVRGSPIPTLPYYTPTIPIIPTENPNETATPTRLYPYPYPIFPGTTITPTPYYPYP